MERALPIRSSFSGMASCVSMTAVTVDCDEKSVVDKAATGRTSLLPRKARPNDVGCSSVPLRLSLRAGFGEKCEKGRTASHFMSRLKDTRVIVPR